MHLFCFSEEGQKQLARVLFQDASDDQLNELNDSQKKVLRDQTDGLLLNVANVNKGIFLKCKDLAGPLWLYRLRTRFFPREHVGEVLTKEKIEGMLPANMPKAASAALSGQTKMWSEVTRSKVAASTAEKNKFPEYLRRLGYQLLFVTVDDEDELYRLETELRDIVLAKAVESGPQDADENRKLAQNFLNSWLYVMRLHSATLVSDSLKELKERIDGLKEALDNKLNSNAPFFNGTKEVEVLYTELIDTYAEMAKHRKTKAEITYTLKCKEILVSAGITVISSWDKKYFAPLLQPIFDSRRCLLYTSDAADE